MYISTLLVYLKNLFPVYVVSEDKHKYTSTKYDAGDDMTANKHSDPNLDKITVNIMNNTLIVIFIHNFNQIENYATTCNTNNINNNKLRLSCAKLMLSVAI